MSRTSTGTTFEQILDPASRPDPYPLFARLREQPVSHEFDGSYVVSRYADIRALLADPRISSDLTKSDAGKFTDTAGSFLVLDEPEHHRLRSAVMTHFHAALVNAQTALVERLATETLDGLRDRTRLDIVADFAYPLPVTVITSILGVPREDEHLFHAWTTEIAHNLNPTTDAEQRTRTRQAETEMADYLGALAKARHDEPRDDLISALFTDDTTDADLTLAEVSTNVRLLLVAGHETTVNLITNGMLTLLRHPDVLARLRAEPELIDPMLEELVRYEPPLQMRARTALADIEIAGASIPRGATVILVLAAGNRDPDRFADPERFVPDREDNEHLGFGGGMHYCVGAPLARLVARTALTTLVSRLHEPRLVVDPPPYQPIAGVRSPTELLVDVDLVR